MKEQEPRKPLPSARSSSQSRGRSYRGQSDEERREVRRQRLNEAALELFSRDGYANTSIEELCRQAGVATRHFYEEFSSREALLWSTYDWCISRAKASIGLALQHPTENIEELIRRALSAFLHAYLDDPRVARIICVESLAVGRSYEKARRSVFQQFASLTEEYMLKFGGLEGLSDTSRRLLCLSLSGAADELVVEWLWSDEPEQLSTLEHELVRLFLAVFSMKGP